MYAISPDGRVLYEDMDGDDLYVDIESNGTFSFTIVPEKDMAGLSAGKWTLGFCPPDKDYCWVMEFTISL